jgi:diadenosine tetraphosphate (Ap4A) HIT family hydrolase
LYNKVDKKIKIQDSKSKNLDQLIFPLFSVKEGKIDLLKGITILNESLLNFFKSYKEDGIEIILLENDLNIATQLKEKFKINESRFKILNSDIEEFLKNEKNDNINFRYIATEISWRFKMSCTKFSQKIQKIIGSDSLNKIKEQNKSAILNTCYSIDIIKNSSLYVTNKVKKIILINAPNMNPERPNQLSEDEALKGLKQLYNNLFKEFEKNVKNNKFMNLFKIPKENTNLNDNSKEKASVKTSWSDGLLLYIRHPEHFKDSIYKIYDKFMVIYDKYPKAKYHLLIIPKEEIKSIYYLNKSHLPLIKDMIELSKEVINDLNKKNGEIEFQIGFHAIPSMNQVHMHVISRDFISPFLKTKKHWNTFTSEFFLKPSFIIEQLNNNGCIKLDRQYYENILKQPLKCCKCGQDLKNMPTLKAHLTTHI